MWVRRGFCNLRLLFAIICLGLAGALPGRAEDKPSKKTTVPGTEPAARPPQVKKEDFRFEGKNIDHWRKALRTELKPRRRLEALEAIKAFSANGYGKEAMQTVLDMARTFKADPTDKDKEVFQKALSVFRDRGQAAEPMLVNLLGDTNKQARSFAAAVLACHVKSISKAAVPGLIRATVDGEEDDKWLAVPALAKIDDLDVLLKKELQEEKKAKKFVKALMELIEKQALANLAPLAASSDPESKEAALAVFSAPAMAVLLLGELGSSARDAVPCLLKAMNQGFSLNGVDVAAAVALGNIGAAPEKVVPALAAALKKDNDALRMGAAHALGQFGPRAKAAIPALRETLANKDVSVCLAAFDALNRIGEDAGKTVPVVLGVLKKADRAARLEVYKSLQKEKELPLQGFVPLLLRVFERLPDDRPEIAVTLGHFGPMAKDAIGVLTKALDDNNPKLQRAAADALRRIGKKGNSRP